MDKTQTTQNLKKHFPQIEFKDSPDDLLHWGQDWTRFYTPNPLCIAFPSNTQEVSALLNYCNSENISVVPSGGRTGLAGGAVAKQGELVVSLSKLRKLDKVNQSASTLRTEAGVVTKTIQEAAQAAGLYWPVDLAASGSCQIGGNIATNAGGLHVIRYGHTRRWIQSLEVVLMNGDIIELNGNLDKNNTGYDFRNLFIGSEGTLGIVTAATLKLCEPPKSLHTFLFALNSFDQAIHILAGLRSRGLVIHTYEVFSKNCIQLVQKVTQRTSPFAKDTWEQFLLFEIDTQGSPETLQHLNTYIEELFETNFIEEGFLSQSPKDARDYWFWRENITESLNTQGKVYKNDIAIPIISLPSFMTDLEKICSSWFGKEQLFLFGHIGDGNIHINLLKPRDMNQDEFLKKCEFHNDELFALIKKYKGSIAAEHGIGLLKARYLNYSKSSEEIRLMQETKKLFDTKGLLNPGKLFPSKDFMSLSSFRIVWKDYDLGLAQEVKLYPHSPKWSLAFDKFCELFVSSFPDLPIQFHHVGSTSIGDASTEGIRAKPIVDILGEVPSLDDLDSFQKKLEESGFIWKGENGISGRRFLKLKSSRGPETFFHIHLFQRGSDEIHKHLLFRDYLKAHPLVAQAYQNQKMRLQSLFHESRKRYTETKASMIHDILAKANFWYEQNSI